MLHAVVTAVVAHKNTLYTVGVQGNPDQDALFTELFDTRHYNRFTRPVFDLSETIHVQLGLVLQKIVQVVCNSLCHYRATIYVTD